MTEQRRCQYALKRGDEISGYDYTCSLTSYACSSTITKAEGGKAKWVRDYRPNYAAFCPAKNMPSELADKLRAVNFRDDLIAHVESVIASWKKVGYDGDTRKVLRECSKMRNKSQEAK